MNIINDLVYKIIFDTDSYKLILFLVYLIQKVEKKLNFIGFL